MTSTGQAQVRVVIDGSFTDPGYDQPAAGTHESFTVTIDWGDGKVETIVPKVPAASTKEGFTVSWKASKTKGVTYELIEATDPEFTQDVRTVPLVRKTSAKIYGGTNGLTYYYRVRAVRDPYSPSDWVMGAGGCTVHRDVAAAWGSRWSPRRIRSESVASGVAGTAG